MLAPQGLHVQPGILCQSLLSAQRHHLLFHLWPVPQWLAGVQIAGWGPAGSLRASDIRAACELLTSGRVENENEAHLDTWDPGGCRWCGATTGVWPPHGRDPARYVCAEGGSLRGP